MEPTIVQRLLHINQEFYQTFARSFSETRQRLQPGVLKAIGEIAPGARLLDLGCGNGLLATTIASKGHRGSYTGIDSSEQMLSEARNVANHPKAQFLRSEFVNEPWTEVIETPFDHIFAFAVVHHLPGASVRARWFREVRLLLTDTGAFTFSHWNFLSSDRLKDRIVPWSHIDLEEDDLESGDFLLDWRRDGDGFRYVHAFQEDEIESLLAQADFEVLEYYLSDGENGKLGSYYVTRPV